MVKSFFWRLNATNALGGSSGHQRTPFLTGIQLGLNFFGKVFCQHCDRRSASILFLTKICLILFTLFTLSGAVWTFLVGDMFSLSLWIWEISRCYSSGAIVTGPALSHFANLLDSSKFFISPSMPAFFDVMFTLNIQLWNTIRMRWDITLLQFRRHRNFHLFNCRIPFIAAALCAYCAYSFSLVENYWSFGSRSMM